MTDKQINIVEILAEQCKNCTLYEGDTVSLNISIFDRPLKGVCFNNNIYFSVDELNCIMQKLISKEQECERLGYEIGSLENDRDILQEKLNQLKAENEELTTINARLLGRLEVDEKDTSLVFNLDKELRQKEKEFYTAIQKVVKLKQTLTEIKEIAEKQIPYLDIDKSKTMIEAEYDYVGKIYNLEQRMYTILQKISECEVGNEL